MTRSVILAARRSAIAPRNGALSKLSIEELASPVINALLSDIEIDYHDVNELILSNALGGGGNPARIVSLKAGLPETVAGLSIDRQCVGGLDALLIADALVRSGQCNVVIAGGAESYSRMPLRYRTFHDGREPQQYTQAQFTPWSDRDPDMAVAANNLAKITGISKSEQDEWALSSHEKAAQASPSHLVDIAGVTKDTFTRNLTPSHCERATKICETITAANMSVAADGAAFVLIASESWAANRNLKGLELLGGVTLGGDPTLPGLAPVEAIKETLARLSLSASDLSTIEVMEAFAVQAIACVQGAELDPLKVNRWGGSLARGHPIGASGAVLAVQLFHQLKESNGIGLAAIAAAGGLGTALVIGH